MKKDEYNRLLNVIENNIVSTESVSGGYLNYFPSQKTLLLFDGSDILEIINKSTNHMDINSDSFKNGGEIGMTFFRCCVLLNILFSDNRSGPDYFQEGSALGGKAAYESRYVCETVLNDTSFNLTEKDKEILISFKEKCDFFLENSRNKEDNQ